MDADTFSAAAWLGSEMLYGGAGKGTWWCRTNRNRNNIEHIGITTSQCVPFSVTQALGPSSTLPIMWTACVSIIKHLVFFIYFLIARAALDKVQRYAPTGSVANPELSPPTPQPFSKGSPWPPEAPRFFFLRKDHTLAVSAYHVFAFWVCWYVCMCVCACVCVCARVCDYWLKVPHVRTYVCVWLVQLSHADRTFVRTCDS